MIVVTNSKDIADNTDVLGRQKKTRHMVNKRDKKDMIDDEMTRLVLTRMLEHMQKTGRINEAEIGSVTKSEDHMQFWEELSGRRLDSQNIRKAR